MRPLPLVFLALAAAPAAVSLREQEIAREFGVGYAVTTADVNGDRRPDVVAINPTQVVWFENPSWQRRVVAEAVSKRDNVSIAAYDVDGDRRVDLALGADWQPSNTASGGSLQWLARPAGTGEGAWRVLPLGEEPTLHRIRFGDVDGDGRAELVVVPLHGRGTKGPGWEGAGARILVYRIPRNPALDPWPVEVADDQLHIVHNFIVENFDGDPAHEIVTASREGIHVLERTPAGAWSKQKIAEGAPGEIKLGRAGGRRCLATIEPWHGTSLVLHEERNGRWERRVVDESLNEGHALGWGDFDGDGHDELAAGWRRGKVGLALYKLQADGSWQKTLVDDGGMATEDLTVADLDGNGRPEIIACGRSTANVKIYWNGAR